MCGKSRDSRNYWRGKCPLCNRRVIGYWDWLKGRLYISGYCKRCDYYILEDEIEWEPYFPKEKEVKQLAGEEW